MSIEVRGVTKRFGSFEALHDITVEIPAGQLVALLGPSGSGKTTLLRIIAGLEAPDVGTVLLNGEETTMQHVRERRVGFVFQHYALFRHMTVFENIAFGLRVRPRTRRPSDGDIRKRVHDLLHLVQLDALTSRYPSQLSGGQRQRVALARALAVEPKVLLLDEPFGSLDAKVRQELRRWLRRLHDELHITSVFVTHDQEEALEVADRVVVMNEGQVVQVGTPEEVYHHPATPFIYNFLGDVNLFRGRVLDGKVHVGAMTIDLPEPTHQDGGTATIYLRPHLLDIDLERTGKYQFRARLVHINPAGPRVKLELISEWGDPVQAELTQERYQALGLTKGADVFVTVGQGRVFVDDSSEAATRRG